MNEKPLIIVVGLDYSDHSDVALARGFELASDERTAELHVITVLPPANFVGADLPKSVLLEVEVAAAKLQRYVAAGWADFSRGRQGQSGPLPRRVVSHVRFDQPARGIVQLASDLSADLIVVGTHGRQGLTRLVLGSVSERVLRLAACPVLVMRPKSVIAEDSTIESPCSRCQQQREQSSNELWCEEHRTRSGRSHTSANTMA